VNYAFIDGQNFYKSIQEIEEELESLEVKLDLNEFLVYLREKHAVRIAFYFIGYLPRNKALYEDLKAQGYELVFKEVSLQGDAIKGNVGVGCQ
jgi:hypothetical protein